MKLHTNIKYYQTICRKQEPLLITLPTFFMELFPLYIYIIIYIYFFCVCSMILKHFEIFLQTLYKYKASSDNLQSLRTIIQPTILTELCPFVIFNLKIVLAEALLCIFIRVKYIFMKFGMNIKYSVKKCTE